MTAYRKLAGFRGEAQFRTWLLAITWRKAIDRRKSVGALAAAHGHARPIADRRRATNWIEQMPA